MAELGERLSGEELNDWVAFGQIEGYGEEQADRRAALIAHTLIAVNTPKKKTPPSFDDVLRQIRPSHPRRVQSSEELRAGFSALAALRARRERPSGNPRSRHS